MDVQPTALRRYGVPAAIVLGIALVLGLSRVSLVAVLVNGLQVGAIYALVALGIALVYRATRVLNFAQGELGSVPAFVVFLLLTRGRLDVEVNPAGIGALELTAWTLIAILVGAVLAILINLVVIQRLADASPVTSLVATIGVALLFTALELVIFEAKGRKFPRFIDGAPCMESQGGECVSSFAIGGVVVTWHTLIVMAVLAVSAAMLALFFRTPVGVALLATAQEPFAAELQGVSTKAMSALAWGTAGALAALGGVLGGGVFEFIGPGFMTSTFLIPAIVAAVLGGITSMVGAVVGGLVLGISVAFANSFVLAYDLTSVLPGPPQIMTFAVLLIVLLFRPRGLFGKEA